MKIVVSCVGLATALAIATALLGWWTVPLVSALWTLGFPRRGNVMIAAVSGAAAWGLLLLIVRRDGPVGALDHVISGTLQMPPGSAIALTLVYAALLSGAAALVAQTVRPAPRAKAA